jgi:hypothetical protein
MNAWIVKNQNMAVAICKCGSINSIHNSTCGCCYAIHQYGYVCKTCMFEGLNGPFGTCHPCKEQAIYDSVPELQDPPEFSSSSIKKTRLPDRYSTSRRTRYAKQDPYYLHKYWKRQHQSSITQFRNIKYNV